MALGKTNAIIGENITPEVTEQTPLIAEIESILAVKAGLKTMSGQYAWKKSEIISITGILSITQLNSGSEPTEMQVTSSDVDLDLLTTESFLGATSTANINGNERTYTFEIYNDDYCLKVGQEGNWSYYAYEYNPSTHIISIPNNAFGSIFTWNDLTINTTTLGDSVYVISNDATAYPNGEELDNYYYESVV